MLVFAMPEDVSRSSTAFPLYRAVTSGNSPGWHPDSGEAGAVPGCLIRLCGGSDVLGGAVGGRGAGVDLGWWFEQAAAQVVQQAEPGGCGVHAAPAAGGAVQHGP